MAELSGFFPDIGGDRTYTDDFLAEWVASFVANGVFSTELAVTAGENMQVILQPGRAWINGRYYHNTAALQIDLDNSDGVLNRYTSVMLRADKNNRIISAQAVNSTYSANPTAVSVTRDSEIYDLKLADIYIKAGAIAIAQADISDKRLDPNLCGIVYCPVDHIDTATLSAQLENWFSQFTASSTQNFQTWFDSIKDILDDEAAGNLLELINQHKADTTVHITADERTKWNGGIIGTYTHSKSGTVHNLAGSGSNVKFKATAEIANGDTWTVNGTAVTAATQTGDALTEDFFKSGNWVSAIFDGTRLNFKSGGSYGTLAAQINNFYATIGNASVKLTWNNPADSNYSGVAIIRKTGGYPTKVSDGTKIYEGSAQTFTDTGLTNGTQYYYRAFAYNAKHEYQTEYCVATMTPLQGYQLGTFPVGTKIKFGSIFGNPIVQRIANISGSDITLITDGVIARYAYDASEPNNPDTNRKNYGNNRYIYSNIHSWLNSAAAAGAWYSAKHSYDQSPDSTSHVTANPYSTAAGFLNAFTTKEQNYLKAKTITVGKATTDGGGTETVSAKIWLPSGTEVGLSTDFTEGTQLSAFSDNASRIAYETADCASHTGGTSGAAQYYWLRTPYASDASNVRFVGSDGSLSNNFAYSGTSGVRPLCFLDSSVLISLTPDASGAYTVL